MSPRHRDRSRKPARAAKKIAPKSRILVVAEGEVTEPEYLRGFVREQRTTLVEVVVAKKHGVPKTVVEEAKRLRNEAQAEAKRQRDEHLAFDEVWCVFDVDEHPHIPEAREMANKNEIELAISNPNFEIWLLLHFRDSPGPQTRHTIPKMLRKFLPNYEKHLKYEDFSPYYAKAVERAARLDMSVGNAPPPNPSTGVYQLTERIRDLGNRNDG